MRRIADRVDELRSHDTLRSAAILLLLVVLASPVLGFVSTVASHVVPDSMVRTKLEQSIEREQLNAADYGQAVSGRQIDYFTDCIGITIGLPDERDASALRSAIATPTGGRCSTAVPALAAAQPTGEIAGGFDYFRYWHGYTVVTRPAIALLGLAGTRVLTLGMLLGLLYGLGRSLARAHGGRVPVLLLAPLILTTDLLELPRSLPHAVGAGAAIGLAWYVHSRTLKRPTLGEISWSSGLAGAGFLYFDILTMPPGAAMLTVGAVGLALSRVLSGARLAAGLLVALAAWSIAWASMWVAKWVIAATVFGTGTVIDVVRFTAEVRLDGNAEAFDFGFLNTTRTMLVVWKNQPLTTPLMFVTCGIALAFAIAGWQRAQSRRIGDRLLLAAPAGIAVVWYEVMRNHSQNHGFFTYRSVAISAGLVLVAAVVSLPALGPDDDEAVADDLATPESSL